MRSEAAFGAAKEALLKADEELRRKHGLPLRRVLRDAAESLSTAQSEPLRQHRRAGFLDRAVLSDPFSGIATPVESLGLEGMKTRGSWGGETTGHGHLYHNQHYFYESVTQYCLGILQQFRTTSHGGS